MLRDLQRAVPIGDILAWMADPHAPLPSGAERAAQAWLRGEKVAGGLPRRRDSGYAVGETDP